MLRRFINISFTLATLLGASISVQAKHTNKHTPSKKQASISLRLQTSKDMQTYSFQKKKTFTSSNSLILRKGFGKHFNLETGVKYTTAPSVGGQYPKTIVKNNQVSIPVTAQYTFLKEKSKVRPYCGVGFQYNIYPAATNATAPVNKDGEQQSTNSLEGNKRISILFTQGVTFEVNTKIQVNQSFHFIPDQNMKTIGIDLGVGYKFR